MKARFFIEVELELGRPDDYPPEVTSWREAAQYEQGFLSVQHSGGADIDSSFGRVQVGDEPFSRATEGAIDSDSTPAVTAEKGEAA